MPIRSLSASASPACAVPRAGANAAWPRPRGVSHRLCRPARAGPPAVAWQIPTRRRRAPPEPAHAQTRCSVSSRRSSVRRLACCRPAATLWRTRPGCARSGLGRYLSSAGARAAIRDREHSPDPDHLEFPNRLAARRSIGPAGLAVVVKGESMAARGIFDGDVVWVNPERAYQLGKVVLALVTDVTGDAGMVVKTYARSDVGECLMSETVDGRTPRRVPGVQSLGPVVGITSWRLPASCAPVTASDSYAVFASRGHGTSFFWQSSPAAPPRATRPDLAGRDPFSRHPTYSLNGSGTGARCGNSHFERASAAKAPHLYAARAETALR